MPSPFSCRAPAWAGGVDLCYMGGSCADATNATSVVGAPCVGCAPGWTNDLLVLHNANCVAPTTLYEVLFAVNTPLAAAAFAACAVGAVAARRRGLRADAAAWLVLAAAAASLWVLFLGDYAQGGMYEVGALGFAGTLFAVGVSRSLAVSLVVASAADAARWSASADGASVARALDAVVQRRCGALRVALPAYALVDAVLCAGMIVTCRGNVLSGVFNAWAVALLWTDAAVVLLLEPLHVRSLGDALRAVRPLVEEEARADATTWMPGATKAARAPLAAAHAELRMSRLSAATAGVSAGLTTFGLVLYIVVGSIPWLWPSLLVLFVAVYLAVGTTAGMLAARLRRARNAASLLASSAEKHSVVLASGEQSSSAAVAS